MYIYIELPKYDNKGQSSRKICSSVRFISNLCGSKVVECSQNFFAYLFQTPFFFLNKMPSAQKNYVKIRKRKPKTLIHLEVHIVAVFVLI